MRKGILILGFVLAFIALAGPAHADTTSWTTTSEPGCSFSASPTGASFDNGGGEGSIALSTGTACTWKAQSWVSWITITAGNPGSGQQRALLHGCAQYRQLSPEWWNRDSRQAVHHRPRRGDVRCCDHRGPGTGTIGRSDQGGPRGELSLDCGELGALDNHYLAPPREQGARRSLTQYSATRIRQSDWAPSPWRDRSIPSFRKGD